MEAKLQLILTAGTLTVSHKGIGQEITVLYHMLDSFLSGGDPEHLEGDKFEALLPLLKLCDPSTFRRQDTHTFTADFIKP